MADELLTAVGGLRTDAMPQVNWTAESFNFTLSDCPGLCDFSNTAWSGCNYILGYKADGLDLGVKFRVSKLTCICSNYPGSGSGAWDTGNGRLGVYKSDDAYLWTFHEEFNPPENVTYLGSGYYLCSFDLELTIPAVARCLIVMARQATISVGGHFISEPYEILAYGSPARKRRGVIII